MSRIHRARVFTLGYDRGRWSAKQLLLGAVPGRELNPTPPKDFCLHRGTGRRCCWALTCGRGHRPVCPVHSYPFVNYDDELDVTYNDHFKAGPAEGAETLPGLPEGPVGRRSAARAVTQDFHALTIPPGPQYSRTIWRLTPWTPSLGRTFFTTQSCANWVPVAWAWCTRLKTPGSRVMSL